MIQNRLGRDQFLAFLQHTYQRYQFQILHLSDFQSELETFTGQSWANFFDQWLRTSKATDWAITDVETHSHHGAHHTIVHIEQQGEIAEPVDIQLRGASGAVTSVRLNPQELWPPNAVPRVERDNIRSWRALFVTPEPPKQYEHGFRAFGDGMIDRCFTRHDYRGNGLYPWALRFIASSTTDKGTEDFSKLFIECSAFNYSSAELLIGCRNPKSRLCALGIRPDDSQPDRL